jgi:hypothetical protein
MKRGSRKKRVRLIDRIRAVPHLFAKAIIVHCIIVVTIAAYYSLYKQAHGAEMVGIYTAIAATFVSELAMLLLKTLFKKELSEEEEEVKEDDLNGV